MAGKSGKAPSGLSPMTSVTCNLYGSYHYSSEITSPQNYSSHCSGLYPYYGWGGLEATISPPSQSFSLSGRSHVAAYVSFAFANGGWIQMGWQQGYSNCGDQSLTSYSSPHLYIEAGAPYDPANCVHNGIGYWYGLYDLGPMPNHPVDFTIQYDPAHTQWVLVNNLGYRRNFTDPYQGSWLWGNSGQASVAYETYGNNVTVQPIDFNTIVLKSYRGWIPWTTANMNSGGWATQTYDERYNVNPCVKESNYVNYSHFLADQAPTGC